MLGQVVARFKLHMRCENCLRESSTTLDIPDVVDAPTTVAELRESGVLEHESFVCAECESTIAHLVAITAYRPANVPQRMRAMSNANRVTIHVVLGWKRDKKGRLVAEPAAEAPTARAAKVRAQRYVDAGGAAIAFSRTGEPALGEWDEAVTLKRCGEVPEEALEGMAA